MNSRMVIMLNRQVCSIELRYNYFPSDLLFACRLMSVKFSDLNSDLVDILIYEGLNFELNVEVRAIQKAIVILQKQLSLYPESIDYLQSYLTSEASFSSIEVSIMRLHYFEQQILIQSIDLLTEYWNSLLIDAENMLHLDFDASGVGYCNLENGFHRCELFKERFGSSLIPDFPFSQFGEVELESYSEVNFSTAHRG